MKKIMLSVLLVIFASLFAVNPGAAVFTESIERKDGPEQVSGDTLIITPVGHLTNLEIKLHEDIRKSLADAKSQLGRAAWQQLIPEFSDVWNEYTGGAPVSHAVISDIFDVRFEDELSSGAVSGKPISFGIKLQGLTSDDVFMIITKLQGEESWEIVEFTVGEDDVINIDGTSMSCYAVVKDNGAEPEVDPEDSPQTGVSDYYTPAIFGIVLFGIIAALCIRKLIKRISL